MKLLWVEDQAPPDPTFAQLQWLHAETLAAAQALLARDTDVQIVVVDLAVADGVEAIRILRAAAPLAMLVALSADEQRGTVMGAISAGAAGFIVKTAETEPLLKSLRIALDGGIPLPVALLERRAPDRPGYGTWTPTPSGPDALGYTPDEARVLRLMIRGQPEALMARTLGMDEPTMKIHLAAIFRRLGTSSRSQAVLEAARLGLRFDFPESG